MFCQVCLQTLAADDGNNHTGLAAIENANTIEEHRSKIVRNRVFNCHLLPHTGDKWQSKTLFLSIFDLRLWIVDSVFDCPV